MLESSYTTISLPEEHPLIENKRRTLQAKSVPWGIVKKYLPEEVRKLESYDVIRTS
jgi:hypothetical protein